MDTKKNAIISIMIISIISLILLMCIVCRYDLVIYKNGEGIARINRMTGEVHIRVKDNFWTKIEERNE